MRHLFYCLALAMTLGGCRSFMHPSDPTADDFVERLCAGRAEDARPALEAEAKRTGMALETLLTVFKGACLFRASRGIDEATAAGMAGVIGAEIQAGHAPLTPGNAEPQLKSDPALEKRE